MKSLLRALVLTLVLMSAATGLAAPTSASAQARAHAQPERGDYLPQDLLRAGPNVDPAAARLRRPPEGYGWFQLRNAYVLASLQTGLIVEVVQI